MFARLRVDIVCCAVLRLRVACFACRARCTFCACCQGEGTAEGDGRVVLGPEKVGLDLSFVKELRDQNDFVLVNRAASSLAREAAKKLKTTLYSSDGDHLSVLVLFGPLASCVRCVLGLCVWPCVCVLEFAFSLTF